MGVNCSIVCRKEANLEATLLPLRFLSRRSNSAVNVMMLCESFDVVLSCCNFLRSSSLKMAWNPAIVLSSSLTGAAELSWPAPGREATAICESAGLESSMVSMSQMRHLVFCWCEKRMEEVGGLTSQPDRGLTCSLRQPPKTRLHP
jgi:hypothetical protein